MCMQQDKEILKKAAKKFLELKPKEAVALCSGMSWPRRTAK